MLSMVGALATAVIYYKSRALPDLLIFIGFGAYSVVITLNYIFGPSIEYDSYGNIESFSAGIFSSHGA